MIIARVKRTDYLAKARTLAERLGRTAKKPEKPAVLSPNGNGKALGTIGTPLYPAPAIVGQEPPEFPDYYIDTDEKLTRVLEGLATPLALGIDLETTGLEWWKDRIRLVSITTPAGDTWVVDAFAVDPAPLYEVLEGKRLVAHSALFDVLFLRRAGCCPSNVGCTKILSQVRLSGTKDVSHKIEDVMRRHLGIKLDKAEQQSDWSGTLSHEQVEYAAQDSKHLLELYEDELAALKHIGLARVAELEERFLQVIVSISDTGVPIDLASWHAAIEEAEIKKGELVEKMDGYVTVPLPEKHAKANKGNKKNVPEERIDKVNWRSHPQIVWAFEGALGVTIPLDSQKKKSTSKHNLPRVDHPLALLIGEFNEIRNLSSTYGEAVELRYANGRVYPEWNQCQADTGRMSCSNPPMHGVPKKSALRKAVIAPPGYKIVGGDLSQIEVRVLAALSEDEALREAYLDDGNDIYAEVAKRVTGRDDITKDSPERDICKTIVLGNMYGQGVRGMRLRVELQLDRPFPEKEALEYWQGFFDEYPGVKSWRERLEKEFDRGARETRTRLGRRRLNVETRRQRWNAPIQGLACDAFKSIACEVHERRHEIPGLEVFALVHDEVLCLVPEGRAKEAAPWLKEVMETTGDEVINGDLPEDKRVPVRADVTVMDNWGEKG